MDAFCSLYCCRQQCRPQTCEDLPGAWTAWCSYRLSNVGEESGIDMKINLHNVFCFLFFFPDFHWLVYLILFLSAE